MRASIIVSSFLVAGAFGKPIKRDNASEHAIVWKTVTVYATNIASGSIPTVTVSEAVDIAKSDTEAAFVVPSSGTLNVSAVHYRHQHKWGAYNTTTSAACSTSTSSVQTYGSATQAATMVISSFKLHAFVTDAPWLLEALSTPTLSPTKTVPKLKLHAFITDAPWLLETSSNATLSPQEPVSTAHVFTSSSGKASSTSTPTSDEGPASILPAPTPTPETIPKPVNHSQDQTLEDAEIAESDGSPYSDGVHLLTTVNKWRRIYKLPLLRWNHQLELNALKTGTDGAGHIQNHQLNEGTMAQVITPGMSVKYGGDLGGDTPFELSYVAWLCESSGDVELKSDGKDQCQLVEDNLHMVYSERGHYDILTSKAYTNIGCAFADNPESGNDTPYQGLWVCDLS